MRLLGLDPGLSVTGWGVIDADRGRLSHCGHGAIRTDAARSLAERLVVLMEGIEAVIADFRPDEAAVEETLMNRNALSALKLGHARAIALLAPARAGLVVAEYLPMIVKKAVVGTGHAEKEQVQSMVQILLPGALAMTADAADALAVAICHAHHRATRARLPAAAAGAW